MKLDGEAKMRLTCEAKNRLVGKFSVSPEKADQLLGTNCTVSEEVVQVAEQ